MKKTFFLLFTMYSIMAYTQNGIKVKYAWSTYYIVPQNGTLSEDTKSASLVNDGISVTVSPVKLSGAGFESFKVSIDNKSDKPITIFLDESSYIIDGKSIPVADSHTLFLNIDKPQVDWNIPPSSWAEKELCQKISKDSDKTNLAGSKNVSIYLTYKKKGDNDSKNIVFSFSIEKKFKK